MITRRFLLATLVGVGASAFFAPRTPAADAEAVQNYNALLIWGTDGPKPADKTLKAISEDLDKRLRRILKWKNYFEVGRTNFALSPTKPTRVEMSRECRLEVTHQPDGEIEIQLFGKGKLWGRMRKRIASGETVVLAGDDKDENAWFVVLTSQRPGDAGR